MTKILVLLVAHKKGPILFDLTGECSLVPQDMPYHQDSGGHRYDFGFGMNWKGVISDTRSRQYVGPIASKKAP